MQPPRQPVVDIATLRGRWAAWRGLRRARELDRLRTATTAVESETLRRSNLVLLWAFGLVTGLCTAFLAEPAGASFRLISRLPGWPESYGLTMLGASALICIGFCGGHKATLLAGTVLYSLWNAAMGLVFGANWWWWATHGPSDVSFWWWVQNGSDAPSLAGFLAYGLIAAGTALHSAALLNHVRRTHLLRAETRGTL